MNTYLEIIRPGNAVMAVMAVLLIMLVTGNFTLRALLACFVVFIVTGGGNTINDYFDYKIDIINKPERPIPSGRISLKTTLIYSLSLFTIGIIFAFIIGVLPGIITLFSSSLLILYAYNLKRKLLIGNLSVAFLIWLTFILGGVVVDAITTSIYLGFFPFLTHMMREIVKDMEDMEGDKKEGAKTFPIVYGLKWSSIVAAFFMVFASFGSHILYFIGVLTIFFIPVLWISNIFFLSGAVSILKDQSTTNSSKVSRRIKIGMFIALLSYAAGSPFLLSLAY